MKPLHLVLLLGVIAIASAAGYAMSHVASPQQVLRGATLGVRLGAEGRGRMVVKECSVHGSRMGLRVGDRIVEFEGAPIRSNSDFVAAAARKKTGDKIRLLVERDGSLMSLNRGYRGPIGVTSVETAATQGITFKQVASKPATARIQKKQQVQAASATRPSGRNWLGFKDRRQQASDDNSAAPTEAPRFVKTADWIEL